MATVIRREASASLPWLYTQGIIARIIQKLY